MPSIARNLEMWGGEWGHDGSHWGDRWGNNSAQWYGCIYPRVARYLPSERLLEIAPGYGRITAYLLKYCDRYHGVDLSASCVAHCQKRFGEIPGTAGQERTFVQNDGYSLAAVNGRRFGFIFSWDSLAHADLDVIESYVKQSLPLLDAGGVFFMHHSNLAEYGSDAPNPGERGIDVTGELVEQLVDRHGGKVIIQEKLRWNPSETMLRDCFTLFGRREDFVDVATRRIRSEDFAVHSALIKTSIAPYFE